MLIRDNEEAEFFYFLYHGRVVASQRVDVSSGETEVAQSARMAEVEISEEGEVEKQYSTRHLGVLGPGNYFGEISILTNTRCRATLSTDTKCMLLKVRGGCCRVVCSYSTGCVCGGCAHGVWHWVLCVNAMLLTQGGRRLPGGVFIQYGVRVRASGPTDATCGLAPPYPNLTITLTLP